MSSFFHVSIGDGLYLISSVASGTSMEFGPPTGQKDFPMFVRRGMEAKEVFIF